VDSCGPVAWWVCLVQVRTGQWVGDCFLYTNSSSQRLQYYVGGQVMTLCHLDRPMYLLGYLSKDDRVYLMDKGLNIVSYKVRRSPPRPTTTRQVALLVLTVGSRVCWAVRCCCRCCSTRRPWCVGTSRWPTSCCPTSPRRSSPASQGSSSRRQGRGGVAG
jgi:hypothetical protein